MSTSKLALILGVLHGAAAFVLLPARGPATGGSTCEIARDSSVRVTIASLPLVWGAVPVFAMAVRGATHYFSCAHQLMFF